MPKVSQAWTEAQRLSNRIDRDRWSLKKRCKAAGCSDEFTTRLVDVLRERQAHWIDHLIAGGDPEDLPADLEYLAEADLSVWMTDEQLEALGLLELAYHPTKLRAVTAETIRAYS